MDRLTRPLRRPDALLTVLLLLTATIAAVPDFGWLTARAAGTETIDFVPLLPARLMDSRPGGVTVDGQSSGLGLRAAGSTTELVVAGRGGVADDAVTAALNVTATEAQAPGFVTVYPCGADLPLASNLNYVVGSTVPNSVIVKLGTGGAVCLYTQNPIHLIVDVAAYFPPGASYRSLVPARLLDSREGAVTVDGISAGIGVRDLGQTTKVVVAGRGGVAANARTAVLNVTATAAQAPGFVTVFPCGGALPLASNVNFVTGSTAPNAVIVKIGDGGEVCLYTSNPTHLVVDVGGFYPKATAYTSLVPGRLFDSRAGFSTVDGQFAAQGQRAAGSTTELVVAGRAGVSADAGTVVLNVTATEAVAAGFVAVYPCGGDLPLASSLNYSAGTTVPNSVIVKVGAAGTVCLFTQNALHLVVDVGGYYPLLPLVPPDDDPTAPTNPDGSPATNPDGSPATNPDGSPVTNPPSTSSTTATTATTTTPGGDILETTEYTGLGRQHLPVGTTINYAQSPPVGGNHWPTFQNCGYYAAPIANEIAVHTLEHGPVWITFRPDLPADQIAMLRAAVGGPRVLITPYPGLSDPVVATSWGWQMRIHNSSTEWPSTRAAALQAFVAAHVDRAPETVSCTVGIGVPSPLTPGGGSARDGQSASLELYCPIQE